MRRWRSFTRVLCPTALLRSYVAARRSLGEGGWFEGGFSVDVSLQPQRNGD